MLKAVNMRLDNDIYHAFKIQCVKDGVTIKSAVEQFMKRRVRNEDAPVMCGSCGETIYEPRCFCPFCGNRIAMGDMTND